MNKGHSNNLCAGVIGFYSDTKIERIIEAANKLSKLKNFKRVIIRRVSKDRWGIDVLFKRKKTSNKEPVLKEIVPIITKIIPKKKIGSWDFSGEIIQIKPKIIR